MGSAYDDELWYSQQERRRASRRKRGRAVRTKKLTPLGEIGNERNRQVVAEGWSVKHDDQHVDKSLALAAALYVSPIPLRAVDGRDPWPWSPAWDKRDKHDYRRRLIIAGALIVAEIERLDRVARS